MDPNETLRQLRDACRREHDLITQSAEDEYIDTGDLIEAADKVVELVNALDEWLSKGGFLPDVWRQGRDIPMHKPTGAIPVPPNTNVVGPRHPALNRVGEAPHAYPEELTETTTCKVCGQEVFYDDTDDEGVGIWTHTATGDYFCEVVE